MPCDTISTNTVDLSSLGKLSPELVLAALKALGHTNARIDAGSKRVSFGRGEYIDTATGQSQLARNMDANEIKRAYSAQVIQYQAKKNGWTLKQTGPFDYVAMKQY